MKYFFVTVSQNCKYLERMDLEECNQITDLTLAHLATGCPSLEKLVKTFGSIAFALFYLKCANFQLTNFRHCHIVNSLRMMAFDNWLLEAVLLKVYPFLSLITVH